MKLIVSFLVFFLYLTGFSQTIVKKSSISTGGGSAIVGTTQVIYSLGEVAVQESTQSNVHLSEGFISPDIINAVGIRDYISLEGVTIYPNPTTDILNVSLSQEGNYEYHLFNMMGEELWGTTSDELQYSIAVNTLSSGVYILVIIEHSKRKAISLKLNKL